MLQSQKRRAQIVRRCIGNRTIHRILDIGCAEGYATSFISELSNSVIGVEANIDYLMIAKDKLSLVLFVNASAEHLPFRDNSFQTICILEVLEHLPDSLQRSSLAEADRVLCSNGTLIISSPYKEQIVYTRCIHCEKVTPLYGHLHSFDERKITALLPSHFRLIRKFHLPNIAIISSSNMLRYLPIRFWLVINNILGMISKGYWIVMQFTKSN